MSLIAQTINTMYIKEGKEAPYFCWLKGNMDLLVCDYYLSKKAGWCIFTYDEKDDFLYATYEEAAQALNKWILHNPETWARIIAERFLYEQNQIGTSCEIMS